MLLFESEDGRRGYNRVCPLFAFSYGDALPLVDPEAITAGRRVRVWVCAGLALALSALALGGLALDRAFIERQAGALCLAALMLAISLVPGWSSAGPATTIERARVQKVRLAPVVLMVEWFLVFGLLAISLLGILWPFCGIALVRGFLVISQIALIPLALLPISNVLWFLFFDRSPGWSQRAGRGRGFRLVTRDDWSPGGRSRSR
jgi:hypothetical protein